MPNILFLDFKALNQRHKAVLEEALHPVIDFGLYILGQEFQALIHYPIAPHNQPAYTGWETLKLPVTEKIHAEVLNLPINPG